MNETLCYKGYTGSLHLDAENERFYGRLRDITDIVDYQGGTLAEACTAFIDSVDVYIEMCEEWNKTPDKPCRKQLLPDSTHTGDDCKHPTYVYDVTPPLTKEDNRIICSECGVTGLLINEPCGDNMWESIMWDTL